MVRSPGRSKAQSALQFRRKKTKSNNCGGRIRTCKAFRTRLTAAPATSYGLRHNIAGSRAHPNPAPAISLTSRASEERWTFGPTAARSCGPRDPIPFDTLDIIRVRLVSEEVAVTHVLKDDAAELRVLPLADGPNDNAFANVLGAGH